MLSTRTTKSSSARASEVDAIFLVKLNFLYIHIKRAANIHEVEEEVASTGHSR